MQLIINTANTRLSVKDKLFFIENDTARRQISPKRVSSIAITVNCTLNAAVIKLAAQEQVPIYFFNNFGTVQARMWSPYFKNLASLRRKQLLFYEKKEALTWVKNCIGKKITLQLQIVKRLKTRLPKTDREKYILFFQTAILKMSKVEGINISSCRNTIMGIEGNCSKQYFKALAACLPEMYHFKGRSRKPATDYFNAALNYLYGMTYSVVESGVFAKGLDPFAGYLHTDNYLKKSLVFDMIEPIRPYIDGMLIDLCLEEKLDASHFVKKEKGYWLNKAGKKLIIPTFNEYLYKRIRVDQKVYALQDLIYLGSAQLGNLIDETVV